MDCDKTCNTCRHWGIRNPDRTNVGKRIRECTALGNSVYFRYDKEFIVGFAEPNYSDANREIFTRDDFFCGLWEINTYDNV